MISELPIETGENVVAVLLAQHEGEYVPVTAPVHGKYHEYWMIQPTEESAARAIFFAKISHLTIDPATDNFGVAGFHIGYIRRDVYDFLGELPRDNDRESIDQYLITSREALVTQYGHAFAAYRSFQISFVLADLTRGLGYCVKHIFKIFPHSSKNMEKNLESHIDLAYDLLYLSMGLNVLGKTFKPSIRVGYRSQARTAFMTKIAELNTSYQERELEYD